MKIPTFNTLVWGSLRVPPTTALSFPPKSLTITSYYRLFASYQTYYSGSIYIGRLNSSVYTRYYGVI